MKKSYYCILLSIIVFTCAALFLYGCGTNLTGGGGGSPPPYFYKLTITSTPDGWGTAEANPAGGLYTSGTTIELTAVGSSGYVFGSWEGDATGETSPVYITMTANKNVEAFFRTVTSNTYLLSISVTPEGVGTVEPWGGTYTDGTYVTLTAEATNPGCNFDHWAGDLGGSSSLEIILINGNKNITAEFSSP